MHARPCGHSSPFPVIKDGCFSTARRGRTQDDVRNDDALSFRRSAADGSMFSGQAEIERRPDVQSCKFDVNLFTWSTLKYCCP